MTQFDEEVLGKVLGFSGVDNNCFKLGDQIYEAVEDPEDGLRSCMEEVKCHGEGHLLRNTVFFREPIAQVIVRKIDHENRGKWYKDFVGYEVVGVPDGHMWLQFGTDDFDDYYPTFIFDYTPKEE